MGIVKIQDVHIFKYIDSKLAGLINECSQLMKRHAGQSITLKGEPSSGIYVLAKGKAEAYVEEPGPAICCFQAGDAFGEMSFIDGKPASATIRAVEDETEVIFIHSHTFKKKLEEYPELSNSFYLGASKVLVARLREANIRFLDEKHHQQEQALNTINAEKDLIQESLAITNKGADDLIRYIESGSYPKEILLSKIEELKESVGQLSQKVEQLTEESNFKKAS